MAKDDPSTKISRTDTKLEVSTVFGGGQEIAVIYDSIAGKFEITTKDDPKDRKYDYLELIKSPEGGYNTVEAINAILEDSKKKGKGKPAENAPDYKNPIVAGIEDYRTHKREWPTMSQLLDHTGISPATYYKEIKKLEKSGTVTKEEIEKEGRGRRSYKLVLGTEPSKPAEEKAEKPNKKSSIHWKEKGCGGGGLPKTPKGKDSIDLVDSLKNYHKEKGEWPFTSELSDYMGISAPTFYKHLKSSKSQIQLKPDEENKNRKRVLLKAC